MPGFLVQQGAAVICAHGGQAQATVANPRVMFSGAPSLLISAPWTVSGCPGVPAVPVPPCVTGEWVTGTIRVLAGGQPLVFNSGQSVCSPTGTPLQALACQARVQAQ